MDKIVEMTPEEFDAVMDESGLEPGEVQENCEDE